MTTNGKIADKQTILAGMDMAAADAEAAFNEIPEQFIAPLRDWWTKHVPKAGHKRLGRILTGSKPKYDHTKEE